VNSVIYGLSEAAVKEATDASLRSLLLTFRLVREADTAQSLGTDR